MNNKDLDALKELYSSVYGEEQLNEAPGGKARFWDSNLGRFVANTGRTAGDVRDVLYGDPSGSASRDARQRLSQRVTGKPVKEYPDQRAARISRAQDAAIASADKAEKEKAKTENPTKSPVPGAQPAGSPPSRPAGSPPSRPAGSPPSRPAAASGPVLSKRNGVEGTGVGANFKERAFSSAEKSRYSSVAAKNAASSGAPKPATPAIGKLGNTSFERRTPTSAELRAAQGARDRGASPEKALQAAQKTNLPTQGPTPAIPSASSVAADVAKANSPAVINRPAPAGSALAAQQAQQKSKPPTPGTGIMQKQSYEWPSAKTIRDIAGAYSSIYEAKKKVDQDEDGDNDFADVRVARMIASGVPKAKAIAMVKDKSYNEEVEIDEATAMAKRGHDETEIRNKIAKNTKGGESADRATELENRPTFGDRAKQASREKLARTQRGDFRRTTSSDYGLRLGAHKSDDPTVKAKQKARGAQRSALTPREKKQLNREAYEAYEFVASYLLENNFASTVDDANVIINNMSENWFNQIMQG
jgi:hypothetical protein